MLKLSTHNGIFHADEVTAIALLKIFKTPTIKITRVPHSTKDFNIFDMVIDISKKFDGKKFFDHHQYKGGKSSAGLIWEYLGVEKEYEDISKLIDMVDKQDTGIKKAKPFEYPNLIKCFNTQEIYSTQQDEAFLRAVEFAMVTLNSLKRVQEEKQKAKEIVKNSFLFNNNSNILELESFTAYWQTSVSESMPHIKAVVWKDEEQNNYKIKTVSKKDIFLPQNTKMEFVHSAGFFAVAKDEASMVKYVDKIKDFKNGKSFD